MRWFMLKGCHYTTLGCVTKWECVQKHIYTGVHIAYMIMYTPRKSLFLFIQTLLLPLHYWIMHFCLKKCLPFMYVCTKYHDEPSSSCWNNSSPWSLAVYHSALYIYCPPLSLSESLNMHQYMVPSEIPRWNEKVTSPPLFFFNNNLIMRC